jgi:hypothetical protein
MSGTHMGHGPTHGAATMRQGHDSLQLEVPSRRTLWLLIAMYPRQLCARPLFPPPYLLLGHFQPLDQQDSAGPSSMEAVKPDEHSAKIAHKHDDHKKHEVAKNARMERHSGERISPLVMKLHDCMLVGRR